jgi:microcin C transport system substrate-binding protein
VSRFTRRAVLKLGAGAAAGALIGRGRPRAAEPRHGMSIFGDLKYPPDFRHFDYVNPDAPKGGRLVMTAPNWYFNQNPLTFNTLNGYVTRGDAAPRPELTFDGLMTSAADEPNSLYGLVAESVSISDDDREYRFHLRDTPRFHDGTPLTAEDVAWSIEILKEKGHPDLRLPLRDVESVSAPDPRTVIVRFAEHASIELPLTVAALPVFSKAFFANRDFEASTMAPVLGSGPYKVGQLSAGRFIEYERVPDYWAADLPVNRGFDNFDVIRLEFYRERQAGFEAFKKGDITFQEEFTAKTWATEYDFPAIQDGRVVKTTFPAEDRPKLQAWFVNTRRPKFQDARTREALDLAFDFEWVNKNLFYESYVRASSPFEGSPFQAQGLPSAAELALLEPLRGEIPEAALGEAVSPAPSDGSGRDRDKLRAAGALLDQAGWKREGPVLRNASGEPLSVEFLIDQSVFERVLGKYVESLRAIGVDATIRLVDSAQYESRLIDFDFDIVGRAWSLEATPIETVRNFFHSATADTPGSVNLSGVRSPAVDRLVEAVLAAKDRDTHRTAMLALDRVVRASHYVIPNWTSPEHRVAIWDMFAWPATKPAYAFPYETTWWLDTEKAKRIGKAS